MPGPSRDLFAEFGRPFLDTVEAPVLMVGTEPDVVERGLRAGRLACPTCRGVLRPWGHARPRVLRGRAELLRLRPRRSRCRSCAGTHVLLAESMLLRRADAVEVVGAALTEAAAGAGHRRVAVGLARAAGTVRGWLRRFAGRAQAVRVWFTALAAALDPELGALAPAGSVLADAVAAVGVAARAAALRVGPARPWVFAARVSGGRLLAPDSINTSCPWASP